MSACNLYNWFSDDKTCLSRFCSWKKLPVENSTWTTTNAHIRLRWVVLCTNYSDLAYINEEHFWIPESKSRADNYLCTKERGMELITIKSGHNCLLTQCIAGYRDCCRSLKNSSDMRQKQSNANSMRSYSRHFTPLCGRCISVCMSWVLYSIIVITQYPYRVGVVLKRSGRLKKWVDAIRLQGDKCT